MPTQEQAVQQAQWFLQRLAEEIRALPGVDECDVIEASDRDFRVELAVALDTGQMVALIPEAM